MPDDHPLTTGGLGLLGTRPSEAVVHERDTLLMVGTNFPYTAHLPEPGQAQEAMATWREDMEALEHPDRDPSSPST